MDKLKSGELLITSSEFADFRTKIEALQPLYEMHKLTNPIARYEL